MSKRNFDRIFYPYTAVVTKKILRLKQFKEANEEDESYFGEYRLNTLVAHIKTLRDQVLSMESDWDALRDEMSVKNFNRIREFVEDSMATADEALDKADMFIKDFNRIREFVEESMATADAALDKADMFISQRLE